MAIRKTLSAADADVHLVDVAALTYGRPAARWTITGTASYAKPL